MFEDLLKKIGMSEQCKSPEEITERIRKVTGEANGFLDSIDDSPLFNLSDEQLADLSDVDPVVDAVGDIISTQKQAD